MDPIKKNQENSVIPKVPENFKSYASLDGIRVLEASWNKLNRLQKLAEEEILAAQSLIEKLRSQRDQQYFHFRQLNETQDRLVLLSGSLLAESKSLRDNISIARGAKN